jgi:hypothetical protein
MFYTYAYLREDKTPYYIGKGSNGRIYATQDRIVPPPTDKSRIIFLKQNLTEEEAFRHEVYMIAVYGRKDLGTGILRNLTNGGEGMSGHIQSEEHKRKVAIANTGRRHLDETRRKMRDSWEVRKLTPFSEETRQRMSQSKKGKTFTEDHKQNLSAALKGKPKSKEHIEKRSEIRRGKVWITNGEVNKLVLPDVPIPEGFRYGKVHKINKSKIKGV